MRDLHTRPGLGHGHSVLSMLLYFCKGGTGACGVGDKVSPETSEASPTPNSMTDGPDSAPVNPAVTRSHQFC